MTGQGILLLDKFLLDCAEISQDDRELIIDMAIGLKEA